MIHRLLERNQGMGERNVRAGKRPPVLLISSVVSISASARMIACGILAFGLATAPASAQPADTISNEPGPLLTRGDALTGGIFALGTVAAFPLDKVFASYAQGAIQERRFARQVAIVVEEVAVPGAFIIGASLYGVGKLADNKEMADLGLHGSEAIVIGLLFTGGLKVLAGRARPFLGHDEPHNFGLLRGWKNHDYSSFPSGHTLIAFAAASAVTEETRRFWPNSVWIVGTAMYGGAALVGWSRMFDDKHWMSDVAVGGALGIFAGRKVVRFHHTRPDNALDRWLLGVSIVPQGESGYGWRPIVVPQR